MYSEPELNIYEVGDWKLSLRLSLNLQSLEGIYWEALVSLTTSAAWAEGQITVFSESVKVSKSSQWHKVLRNAYQNSI